MDMQTCLNKSCIILYYWYIYIYIYTYYALTYHMIWWFHLFLFCRYIHIPSKKSHVDFRVFVLWRNSQTFVLSFLERSKRHLVSEIFHLKQCHAGWFNVNQTSSDTTHLKINSWNQNLTQLKRRMIFQTSIFQGVYHASNSKDQNKILFLQHVSV